MKNRFRYIYKITNLVNGKIYVGQRTSRKDFDFDEYYGSGLKLNYAFKKYGMSNFSKELLERCTEANIDEREIFWIKKLNSTDTAIGYNITDKVWGGDTFTKNPNKEVIRQKLKNSSKGKIRIYNEKTDEMRYLVRGEVVPDGFIKGRRPFSKEQRNKFSIMLKGKKGKKYKKRQLNLKIRRHRMMPESVKAKLRLINMGHVVTKETREKLRIANTGHIMAKEAREHLQRMNTGKIKIYNKKTNEERAIDKNDRMPKGFVKGGKRKSAEFKEKVRLSLLNQQYKRTCVVCTKDFLSKGRNTIYCYDCKKSRKHKDFLRIKHGKEKYRFSEHARKNIGIASKLAWIKRKALKSENS
jgi:hypothetical protein